MAVTIAVYADWDGLPQPLRLGLLHARAGAGREILDFELDAAALAHPGLANPPAQGNETAAAAGARTAGGPVAKA